MSGKYLHKFRRIVDFLSLMNVEPVLFTVMFMFALKRTPTDQLIQDKICLFKYNATADYCLRLPRMKPEEDFMHIKSPILEEVTRFSLYHTLCTTVPSLLAALFIGSWTDKYLHAKKALLMACIIGGFLEAAICAANAYFYDQS